MFMNELAHSYVLYVNLWGTTAKILQAQENSEHPLASLYSQCSLIDCQVHFSHLLQTLTTKHPLPPLNGSETSPLNWAQIGDYAYLVSSNLPSLIQVATQLFQKMFIHNDTFTFWPLRAAIAYGTSHVVCAAPTPHSVQFLLNGSAAVRAALLEKSAQKGARLFLCPTSAQALTPNINWPLRPTKMRGMEHFELNWLSPHFKVNTAEASGHPLPLANLASHLWQTANFLLEQNDNYSQQMGASLADLASWSELPPASENQLAAAIDSVAFSRPTS